MLYVDLHNSKLHHLVDGRINLTFITHEAKIIHLVNKRKKFQINVN